MSFKTLKVLTVEDGESSRNSQELGLVAARDRAG